VRKKKQSVLICNTIWQFLVFLALWLKFFLVPARPDYANGSLEFAIFLYLWKSGSGAFKKNPLTGKCRFSAWILSTSTLDIDRFQSESC